MKKKKKKKFKKKKKKKIGTFFAHQNILEHFHTNL